MFALAQNTGKLSGKVIDADTGDSLPGAQVLLVGTQRGTVTDIDGNYVVLGVPSGQYDVQFSFVGYQTVTVTGVEIISNRTREQNASLSAGVELDEIVVEYERPLIQKDAIGVPKTVTAETIASLPVRGVSNIAALQGGVVSSETSGNLFIRGGREQEVAFFVDGVRVIGSLGVPTDAIQEQEMLIGSIPAKYGDAMSGVISVTTKGGIARNLFGSVEAITSEALDDYGYNDFTGTIGGPLVANKVAFFLSAQYSDRGDAGPRAIGFPVLQDGLLEALQANPQSLPIVNDEDPTDVRYIPLPIGLEADENGVVTEAQVDEALAANGSIPEGFSLQSHNPILAALTVSEGQISRQNARPNNSRYSYNIGGNLTFNVTDNANIRLGGTFVSGEGNSFSNARSIYAPEQFGRFDNQTVRLNATWTQYFSASTFYQLQASYEDFEFHNYANGFSNNVEDVLFYGDISHPTNEIASRYYIYDSGANTYTPRYFDGSLPGSSDVHSTYRPPGTTGAGYSKGRNQRIGFRASATTQIGIHQLEFGGEFEQRTNRFFSGGSRSLARFFDDGDVEAGADQAVTAYDQLPFNVMNQRVYYYGYNFLGTEEVDNEDVDTFVAATTSANPNQADLNIAPYQPIYYAGYVQDKLEYQDIVLQLGFRIDAFDNNALVLKDPFTYFPIERASGVDGRPSNIDADFAAYYNEATGDLAGYRDLEGQFYTVGGEEVTPGAILNDLGGRPRIQRDGDGNEIRRLTADQFEDYEPQFDFQPRVGVSFPVTDQALFYASYDVVTQRPSENSFDTIQQYWQATQDSKRNNNSNLRPERTTQYELGFRQRVGERAAVQLSGFTRQVENKIARRIIQNAFPNNYQSYENVDFGTVKGAQVEFDLRRTNNLSINANYTLSFAQGTGADANSVAQITWRQETAPFYPNFLNALDFDQRHKVNVNLDYRLGQNEGPEIGGVHPLSNFGVNLVATVGTGLPYTRRDDNSPLYTGFNGFLQGELNGERRPTTSLINLRLDRRFRVSNRSNLLVYLWVQNLLNTDNVQTVWSQTGLADNDGWLDRAEGIDAINAITSSQGAQIADNFATHYGFRTDSPFNYGIPRQVRLGLRFDF
ncbi:MAG: TonB-dependent receptor [Bacteroidota bacterium]